MPHCTRTAHSEISSKSGTTVLRLLQLIKVEEECLLARLEEEGIDFFGGSVVGILKQQTKDNSAELKKKWKKLLTTEVMATEDWRRWWL